MAKNCRKIKKANHGKRPDCQNRHTRNRKKATADRT